MRFQMTTMRWMRTGTMLLLTAGMLSGLGACSDRIDENTKTGLAESGYDEAESIELSKQGLTEEEVQQLAVAKQGGLDGTAAIEIVQAIHDQDLDFDLGKELQVLSAAGFSSTALVKFVKMGAVRRWEADLRVMKHSGIGESTILNIASRRFVDKKDDVLSGGEYGLLKGSGMSDVGLETFVENGGTPQQLQKIDQLLRMGESEQAAMKKAGL